MRISIKRISLLFSTLSLLLSFFSRLPVEAAGFVKSEDCSIRKEQVTSFMGEGYSPSDFPIQVSFEDLALEYQDRMKAAIDTWNELGRRLLGKDLFVLSSTRNTWKLTNPPPPPKNKEEFKRQERDGSRCKWFKGEHNTVLFAKFDTPKGALGINDGETLNRCYDDEGKVSKVGVVINTKLFAPQHMERVTLHALGHVLGLDHSCNQNTEENPTWIGCKKLEPTKEPFHKDLIDAVMYYKVTAFNGAATALEPNDIERFKCLYGDHLKKPADTPVAKEDLELALDPMLKAAGIPPQPDTATDLSKLTEQQDIKIVPPAVLPTAAGAAATKAPVAQGSVIGSSGRTNSQK